MIAKGGGGRRIVGLPQADSLDCFASAIRSYRRSLRSLLNSEPGPCESVFEDYRNDPVVGLKDHFWDKPRLILCISSGL